MDSTQTHPDLIAQAKKLLRDAPAMTLATSDNGMPWAAPVYYAVRGTGLYFFSSPASRHITEAMAFRPAAAAIHSLNVSWKDLMGLQMTGTVETVSEKWEAAQAIGAYLLKFPFVRDFFTGIREFTLRDFTDRLHAGLYVFLPDSVFFMDNSAGFGFRRPIEKKDLFS